MEFSVNQAFRVVLNVPLTPTLSQKAREFIGPLSLWERVGVRGDASPYHHHMVQYRPCIRAGFPIQRFGGKAQQNHPSACWHTGCSTIASEQPPSGNRPAEPPAQRIRIKSKEDCHHAL